MRVPPLSIHHCPQYPHQMLNKYWLNEWKCFQSTQIRGAWAKVTYLNRPYSQQHSPLMRLFKIGRHLLLWPGNGERPTALPAGKQVSYLVWARLSFCLSTPLPKPETLWWHTIPFPSLTPTQSISKSHQLSLLWRTCPSLLAGSFQLPFSEKVPLPIQMNFQKTVPDMKTQSYAS